MKFDDDQIALAAEYVLGTLSGDERAQVETLMSADPDYKSVVESWELRLGELAAMVGSVEPPEGTWEKIRTAVTAIAPEAAIRLPEISAPAVTPATPPPPPAGLAAVPTNVVQFTDASKRWRGIAQLMTAVAAALVAFIGVQSFRPDLLPERMRPKPVEVAVAPASQLVAVLQRDGGTPAFIMTVDPAAKTFTVRRAGPPAPSNRSYELWMVSDKFAQPRSLGVVGAGDFTTRPALASLDGDTIGGATYAITVEPEGGSPSGAPTSAPIYAGKLLEVVAPAGAK
jgi:anti-sigma-K factor RskA